MANIIIIYYNAAERTVWHLTYTGEEQRSQSSIYNVQNPVPDDEAEDSKEHQDH